MTVSDNKACVNLMGNGTNISYSFRFDFEQSNEILVIEKLGYATNPLAPAVTLREGNDYSVVKYLNTTGGEIIFKQPVDITTGITIRRKQPIEQTINFEPLDALNVDDIELGLDYGIKISQQLQCEIDGINKDYTVIIDQIKAVDTAVNGLTINYNALTNQLNLTKDEVDALQKILPTPASADLHLVSIVDPLDPTKFIGAWVVDKGGGGGGQLPPTTGTTAGQVLSVLSPSAGTLGYRNVNELPDYSSTANGIYFIKIDTVGGKKTVTLTSLPDGLKGLATGTITAGTYVFNIDSNGNVTLVPKPADANDEDLDQSSGVISGLKITPDTVQLNNIKISPGQAEFIENVQGIPTTKATIVDIASELTVAIPQTPNTTFYVYLNKDKTTTVLNQKVETPRGDRILIGSVDTRASGAVFKTGYYGRLTPYTSAQMHELASLLTKGVYGVEISPSTISPTNEFKNTAGAISGVGGLGSDNSFFLTDVQANDPMQFRFLSGTEYSDIWSEFPKTPPTYVLSKNPPAKADLANGHWGYYLLYLDIRKDVEAGTNKTSFVFVSSFTDNSKAPTGVDSVIFSGYYGQYKVNVPKNLTDNAVLLGLFTYKQGTAVNDKTNKWIPATILTSAIVGGAGGSSLPTGTASDIGKVLSFTSLPDNYSLVSMPIFNRMPTTADSGKSLTIDSNGQVVYTDKGPALPVGTPQQDGYLLSWQQSSGSYQLIYNSSGGNVFPDKAVNDGMALVSDRAVKVASLPAGKDLFDSNTHRGMFIKASMVNDAVDPTKTTGLDYYSSDFTGRFDGVSPKLSTSYFGQFYIFIKNGGMTPDVWYTTDTLNPDLDVGQNFLVNVGTASHYVGSSFNSPFDISSRNHTGSPIIIKPRITYATTTNVPLTSFGINYTPKNPGEKIITKVVISQIFTARNIAVNADSFYFSYFIYSKGQMLWGITIFADPQSGNTDFTARGTDWVETGKVRLTGIANFNADILALQNTHPEWFTFETPNLNVATDFTWGLYTALFTNNPSYVRYPYDYNDLHMEFQISSTQTAPKDHNVYDMGTLKDWLADANTMNNRNLTITAGKKLIATLCQIHPYVPLGTADDKNWIFNTSQYNVFTLPSVSLEKADKSDIVHFLPKPLTTNDIIYISDVPVTQDMIDTYIIRIRINSTNTAPLQSNAKDNIKISFVDIEQF